MALYSSRLRWVSAHPFTFLWRVLVGFRANQGMLLSGAVAYYLLLSIIPLLILILLALSQVLTEQELLNTLGQHLNGGGFTCAIGAEKTKALPSAQFKTDALHGINVGVCFRQVLYLNNAGCVHGRSILDFKRLFRLLLADGFVFFSIALGDLAPLSLSLASVGWISRQSGHVALRSGGLLLAVVDYSAADFDLAGVVASVDGAGADEYFGSAPQFGGGR